MSSVSVPYSSVATSEEACRALCGTRVIVEGHLHDDRYGYQGLLSLLHCRGYGQDVTIRELAQTVLDVVGCRARIAFDSRKPDGAPRKLLDVSRPAALGWRARTPSAKA